ncbi:hypothetical protein K493DRAFT_21471 [Basidiobolus meristosporus CBS 931.73]|uniref:SH3 domain-containing protein n=1 Tax=Basidiobolus meristosporus CBS 931.73 TaxID=1314790 RepID=A0A1Y1YDE3_9FUNG|nr:hypothetical protein K493DRAFT_21471 [Basidiobolus meristosporus CBS 931.73]|eukprot:ORX96040.1 hypothetical protein K493DRAFT_21471 [Basidiobolus meristosporus CBS 931.73]
MKLKHHLSSFVILLNSVPSILGGPTADCYSLADSKYCGGSFGGYFLSNKTTVEGNTVADVASLDRAIDYYFGSPQDVRDRSADFHCSPQSTWDGIYFPPYRYLFYCRGLIEDSPSKLCNSQNPVPPTCQANCIQYVADWKFLWGNDTLCNSPGTVASKQEAITQAWCDHFPFNGTQNQCIQPKDTSQTVCGYSLPYDLPALCIYCATNPSASCCSSDNIRLCKTSAHSSGNQLILILPIVIGCLGIIGLVVGAWFYFKKKNQQLESPEHPKGAGLDMIPGPKVAPFDNDYDTIGVPSLPTYTCIYPYEPTLPDELRIYPQDTVVILMTFEDGWGIGRNLTRGGEGALPLACLSKDATPYEETITSRSSSSSIPRRSSSKRESSTPRISHYSAKSS